MVGGDSHRGLEVPNVYYQVHMRTDEFDVLGHSVPGMPMVMHFAHNRHVAWGMTHGGVDTQDLFVEQLRRTDDGVEYLFKGEMAICGDNATAASRAERRDAHDRSRKDSSRPNHLRQRR